MAVEAEAEPDSPETDQAQFTIIYKEITSRHFLILKADLRLNIMMVWPAQGCIDSEILSLQ